MESKLAESRTETDLLKKRYTKLRKELRENKPELDMLRDIKVKYGGLAGLLNKVQTSESNVETTITSFKEVMDKYASSQATIESLEAELADTKSKLASFYDKGVSVRFKYEEEREANLNATTKYQQLLLKYEQLDHECDVHRSNLVLSHSRTTKERQLLLVSVLQVCAFLSFSCWFNCACCSIS